MKHTLIDSLTLETDLSPATLPLDLLSPESLHDGAFDPSLDYQFDENNKDGTSSILDLNSEMSLVAVEHNTGGTQTFTRPKMLDNAASFPPTPDSDTTVEGRTSSEMFAKLSVQVPESTVPKLQTRRQSEQIAQSMRSPIDQQDVTSVGIKLEPTNSHKKQRKSGNVESGAEKVLGRDSQKERSRAKNKVAAAKCRMKKRENMETIESDHRALSAENSLLKREEQQLRASVSQLRTLALDHQNCNCGVHQYNMFEARKLAHGLGSLPASSMNPSSRFDFRTMSMPVVPGLGSAEHTVRPRSQSFTASPHAEESLAHEQDHFFPLQDHLYENGTFYEYEAAAVGE